MKNFYTILWQLSAGATESGAFVSPLAGEWHSIAFWVNYFGLLSVRFGEEYNVKIPGLKELHQRYFITHIFHCSTVLQTCYTQKNIHGMIHLVTEMSVRKCFVNTILKLYFFLLNFYGENYILQMAEIVLAFRNVNRSFK